MTSYVFALALVAVIHSVPNAHYVKGDSAVRAQKWSVATKELEISYAISAQPMTAYLLAYAYSRLGDAPETGGWAIIVLRAAPPIDKQYRLAAARWLAWASAVDHEIYVSYTLSIPGQHSKDLDLLQAMAETHIQPAENPNGDHEIDDAYRAEYAASGNGSKTLHFYEDGRVIAQVSAPEGYLPPKVRYESGDLCLNPIWTAYSK